MPLAGAQNEELRSRGWNVFRSGLRDRPNPMSGLAVPLLKVLIPQAARVAGVTVGAEVSVAAESARSATVERSRAQIASVRPGLSQAVSFAPLAPAGGVAPATTFETDLVTAPSNGFVTGVQFYDPTAIGLIMAVGMRISSGATAFIGVSQVAPAVPNDFNRPDLLDFGGPPLLDSQRPFFGTYIPVRIPFEAGDIIRLATRVQGGLGGGASFISGVILLEYFDQTVRLADRLLVSAYDTRTEAQSVAREVAAAAARPAPRVPSGRQVVSPGAELPPTAPAPDAGAGMTFVKAWMAAPGAVGFLVPTPGPGETITTFGNVSTVFDRFGQKVKEVTSIPVASFADVPASAKLSRDLGTQPSPGMNLSRFVPGTGFVSGVAGGAGFEFRSPVLQAQAAQVLQPFGGSVPATPPPGPEPSQFQQFLSRFGL